MVVLVGILPAYILTLVVAIPHILTTNQSRSEIITQLVGCTLGMGSVYLGTGVFAYYCIRTIRNDESIELKKRLTSMTSTETADHAIGPPPHPPVPTDIVTQDLDGRPSG